MPDYTYAPAPVLVETTGEFAIGATGVLRPSDGGDAVAIYDLNGSTITNILVGPKGAHQGFRADIPYGVLDFGSVLLPTVSQEQQNAALTALATAQEAGELATQASIDASAALDAALAAGKYVIHGAVASTARPATDPGVPIIWFGTVAPTNLSTTNGDLWVNPTGGGGGGISEVTMDDLPAGSMIFTLQAGDGTWGVRKSARTDLKSMWIRMVAGSADPATATSPAVTGAYNGDVVVGA